MPAFLQRAYHCWTTLLMHGVRTDSSIEFLLSRRHLGRTPLPAITIIFAPGRGRTTVLRMLCLSTASDSYASVLINIETIWIHSENWDITEFFFVSAHDEREYCAQGEWASINPLYWLSMKFSTLKCKRKRQQHPKFRCVDRVQQLLIQPVIADLTTLLPQLHAQIV